MTKNRYFSVQIVFGPTPLFCQCDTVSGIWVVGGRPSNALESQGVTPGNTVQICGSGLKSSFNNEPLSGKLAGQLSQVGVSGLFTRFCFCFAQSHVFVTS